MFTKRHSRIMTVGSTAPAFGVEEETKQKTLRPPALEQTGRSGNLWPLDVIHTGQVTNSMQGSTESQRID